MEYKSTQRLFDFLGVIAAGWMLATTMAWSRNSGDLNHPDSDRCLVFGLGSFAVSSLLLLGRSASIVRIPKWFLVAFFGSLLSFVSIVWFGDEPREIPNPTFVDYLAVGWKERGGDLILSIMFVDIPLALAVMAPFHYLPRLGDRWASKQR
jgi:hypothetical protein